MAGNMETGDDFLCGDGHDAAKSSRARLGSRAQLFKEAEQLGLNTQLKYGMCRIEVMLHDATSHIPVKAKPLFIPTSFGVRAVFVANTWEEQKSHAFADLNSTGDA